ncbi:MAG: hypothetical protein WC794_01665 [Candidatus Doudnabacteria bacterium]
MSNNNRNRNNQQGGGGGGNRGNQGGGNNSKIVIHLNIQGKRDSCKVAIALRTGMFALPNEQIMLRLGTPDNPRGPWVMDSATPASRIVLTSNVEGEVISPAFDFTADEYKPYSQIMAVYYRNSDPNRGNYEQAATLPVFEATENVPPKAKGKRLQFKAPEESMKSRDNKFALPTIRTVGKDGKGEAASLLVRASGPISASNVLTGTEIAEGKAFGVKTADNGLLLMGIQFAGFERTVTIVHMESGEEVSFKMEFQY